jgi:hypothetical protein
MKLDFDHSRNNRILGLIARRYIHFVQISSRGRIKFPLNSYQCDEEQNKLACSNSKPVAGFDRVECDCKLEKCPRGFYILHVHIYDYIKSVATLKFNLDRDCKEITFTTKYDREEIDPQTNPMRKVLKSFGYSENDIAKWLCGLNFNFVFDRNLTYLKVKYPEDSVRDIEYKIVNEGQDLNPI